jgi:hypothetical protein
MAKFVFRLLLFVALQALLLGALWQARPPLSFDSYYDGFEAKHRRLEQTKSPGVLLVGGSNVAFGFDSPLLTNLMGRPVTNLGLHAAFGLDFMLNEALSSARDGDLILLSPEYEHFVASKPNDSALPFLAMRHPQAVQYFDVSHMRLFLDYAFHALARQIKLVTTPGKPSNWPYSRDGFNDHGDVIGHYSIPSSHPFPLADLSKLSKNGIKKNLAKITRFKTCLEAKGASMLFVWPTLEETSFKHNKKHLSKLSRAVQKALAPAVIGTPQSFAFKRSLYYDTHYHLNQEGVRQRMAVLEPHLSSIQLLPAAPTNRDPKNTSPGR